MVEVRKKKKLKKVKRRIPVAPPKQVHKTEKDYKRKKSKKPKFFLEEYWD